MGRLGQLLGLMRLFAGPVASVTWKVVRKGVRSAIGGDLLSADDKLFTMCERKTPRHL
jgi:hypothetical protein